MPPIRLDEEARQLMLSYRWPGNVRELKNITERISVIEENRDITASVLRLYLPDLNIEKYPVLVKQDSDQKIFNSEREILYQVLFDMKKDVNELKKLVHDIMGDAGRAGGLSPSDPYCSSGSFYSGSRSSGRGGEHVAGRSRERDDPKGLGET